MKVEPDLRNRVIRTLQSKSVTEARKTEVELAAQYYEIACRLSEGPDSTRAKAWGPKALDAERELERVLRHT